MSVPSSPPLANTNAVIAAAARIERARLEATGRRRRLMHRIDLAIDECERANLRDDTTPPANAAALCLLLQAAGGEAARPAATAADALDELFRLQDRYMLGEADDDLDDLVADAGEEVVTETADPLMLLCCWLEERGRRVLTSEIPAVFRPLLDEPATRALIYRDRDHRRLRRDWRERRALLAERAGQ